MDCPGTTKGAERWERDEQISALQAEVARLTALNDIAVASMKFSKETSDSLKRENEALGIRLAKAMGAKIEEQGQL